MKKIPEATTLIHINQHNTDRQNLEKKIKDVDKKLSNINGLVLFSIDYDTKIGEIEVKITDHDHSKYITTQEFNKLTSKNVTKILKQANLVNKTDFDNKLIKFNRKVTSNKTKCLEVQNT